MGIGRNRSGHCHVWWIGSARRYFDTLSEKRLLSSKSNHACKEPNIPLIRCVVRLCLLHSICTCNHSRKAFNSSPLPPNLHHPRFPSYALHLHGPLHRLVHSSGLPCDFPLQSRSRSLVHDRGSHSIMHPLTAPLLRHQLNKYRPRHPYQPASSPTNLGTPAPQETTHPPNHLHVPRNSQYSRRYRSHSDRPITHFYKSPRQHRHALLVRHH